MTRRTGLDASMKTYTLWITLSWTVITSRPVTTGAPPTGPMAHE
ncbi:hypothetical protein [Saccharothrix sp. ALI-22-I]|nr:hypothetical protein [Saccharothrix sp. ALI-22-I]